RGLSHLAKTLRQGDVRAETRRTTAHAALLRKVDGPRRYSMPTAILQSRIENPAMAVPGALPALHALGASARKGIVPARTLLLIDLRVSQINGCSVCLDMHARE